MPTHPPRLLPLLTLALLVSVCSRPPRPPIPPPSPAEPRPPSAGAPRLPGPHEIRLNRRWFTPPEEAPDWAKLTPPAGARRAHLVVQLRTLPDLYQRAALAEAGLTLLQPLTGKAYLATDAGKLDVAALRLVRWAGRLRAEDKVELGWRPSSPRVPGVREWVVKLFPDGELDAVATAVGQLGGRVLGKAPAARVLTVSLSDARFSDLVAIDDVRFVETLLPPGQAEGERARGHVNAHLGAIPAGAPTGSGVTVGIFEGGHGRVNHQALVGRLAQGDAGNLVNDTTFNTDHATMSAGMIGGDGTGSAGRIWRGFAPAATLRAYNFANTDPNAADSIANYLNDVTEAVQNDDVKVANNSWGDSGCTIPYGSYAGRVPFLDGVVRGDLTPAGAAQPRRPQVVFSAGNERAGVGNAATCITNTTAPFENYNTVNHPKAAKNVLSVGAIDSATQQMSSYSSWGPTLDGRIKPEIVASGHHNGSASAGITSINNAFGSPNPGAPNQQGYRTPIGTPSFVYGWFTQTSSAAAAASGTLALLIDAWRTTFPGRPDPLPSTLRALLVHNASDLSDATTWFNPGPDYASGYGLMQVNRTISSLERREALEGALVDGETRSFFLRLPTNVGTLKVTLAWDDAPAIENANPALVNDLDLVVRDPSGTQRFPWTLDPANRTAAAVRTAADHRNNLEQVFVDSNVTAGVWTVEVVGTAVPQGPQTFSVVADNGPVRRPVDLVLALDTSGSMSDPASTAANAPTKISLLRDAATLVLETWALHAVPGDRAGLAAFSDNVSNPAGGALLQDFPTNLTGLTGAIGGLQATGCTAMGGALQVAFDSFDPASPNKRGIILFTDGMHSANPFVGEAGSPARLQLQQVAANATPPFGGFFCTSTTASGPAGPINLDGRPLDQHGAQIHTIGLGVQGANYQTLLSRIADEGGGLHHFTSTPVSNLDLFYTADLVQALKSNTLEIIATDAGQLGNGGMKELAFPVNQTASSVTVVLSWRGARAPKAVPATVIGPTGATLTADTVKDAGFFTLLKFNLPGRPGAIPGFWRLRFNRPGSAVSYQVSVLAEEPCFHFDFRAARRHQVGKPLRLEALIDTWGRVPIGPLVVKARLRGPAVATGKLLSDWVPRTRAWRAAFGGATPKPEPGTFEKVLAELSRNRTFMARATETKALEAVLVDTGKAGDPLAFDGRFVAVVPSLTLAGSYDVSWSVEGQSACGQIARTDLATIVVAPPAVDPGKTVVTLTPGSSGTTTVTVKPSDATGSPLGPGLAVGIAVAGDHELVGAMLDRFDGTYVQQVSGRLVSAAAVRVLIDAKPQTPAAK